MKDVSLPASLLDEIRAHGRETYPDECCGFLIGGASGSEVEGRRSVLALERARNEFDGERRRRFLIRPEEVRDVERRAEAQGRSVVGFYHSHPDHPARPSQFDQEHAWPWYTYIVVSVTRTESPSVGAFELDPETATFRPVNLRVDDASETTGAVTGG